MIYFSWSTPQHVDELLWSILVAAMNSKDTNDLTPYERAEWLYVYRSVTRLLHALYEMHEAHKSQD